MDPSITCFYYMGSSIAEKGVFARRVGVEYKKRKVEFVIKPLPPEECVVFEGQFVRRAIVEIEGRTLHVGSASYGIDGVRYRWMEQTQEGEMIDYNQVEQPGNVFSRVPIEVKIAASTTVPQTIRI